MCDKRNKTAQKTRTFSEARRLETGKVSSVVGGEAKNNRI